MPTETPEALARTMFDSIASGDFSPWEARLAPDFTASYPGLRGAHPKEAAKAFNQVSPLRFPASTSRSPVRPGRARSSI